MARRVVEDGPANIEVWAETEKFRARRVYEVDDAAPAPDTVDGRVAELDAAARAIAAVVDDHRAEHRHLLAHGKRWSFGSVVRCQDGVIETHGTLDQVIDATRDDQGAPHQGRLWQALTPAARAAGEYAYVEAGVEIEALMDALDERKLAVITAGSSSGQSLAGVINTASHGGDFELPPIPDMVRAVVIVGPDGVIRWVEPQSNRVTAGDPCPTLLPCAELLADDDAFRAALVTIGTLGVIVAYVVQVRPAYGLWETVEESWWPTVRPMLEDGSIFDLPATWSEGQPLPAGGRFRGLEVLINPFLDPDEHKRRVFLVRRAEHDDVTDEDWKRAGFFEKVKNALIAIFTLASTISEDVDDYGPGVDQLLRTGREDSKAFAPVHRVLNYGNSRLEHVWSVDVVLPTTGDAHLDFLDAVIAELGRLTGVEKKKFAGFLTLRFSTRSAATLAMQNDGTENPTRFAQIELFCLQAPFDLDDVDLWREEALIQDGIEFYEAFCDLAEAHRPHGLRVHWGQMMRWPESYAPPEDPTRARWRAGRDRLVGGHPYVFATELAMRAGVIEPPPGFTLDGVLPAGRGDRLTRGHHLALVHGAPIGSPGYPLFACDATGRVSTRVANGPWTAIRPDQKVDGDECPAGRLLVGARKDGRVTLVSRDRERRLRATIEQPGGWRGWERVDRRRVDEPALVATPEGLELFAVSERGLERFREKDERRWDRLDRVPGGGSLTGPVSAVRVDGGTLILGRRADDTLVTHRVDGGGWTVIGASRREPSLLAMGTESVAVWLTDDSRVRALRLDASGAAIGAARTSATQPGLTGAGRFVLSADGASVRVAFVEAGARRVRVYVFDPATGAFDTSRKHEVKAVGSPLLLGDQLLVKVAHDILVRAPI